MKLSIVIATYNHEKYIKKAIDSVLKQQIDYSFEVWIGDDGSTDNTPQILKKYSEKTPSNYHYIIRKKNIGTENNFNDLYKHTSGEYLIVLEGDDYWTYPLKIQKQIEFLDNNKDYVAIAHNTEVVDENNNINKRYSYPECKNNIYTLYDFRDNIFAGQTTTIMSRNYYKYNVFPILKPSVPWPGDRTRNFLFAAFGKVHCIQEKWSAYRYVTTSGDSFSANFESSPSIERNLLQYHKELYTFSLQKIKSTESIVISESMYFHLFLTAIIKKKFSEVSLWNWIKEFIFARYKIKTLFYIIKQALKK